MKYALIIVFSLLLYNCNENKEKVHDADEIIRKAIEISGGSKIDASTITFDFRDKHYKAIRGKGQFQYERNFTDSIGMIKDVLDNSGFKRFVNGVELEVPDDKQKAYSASVNSVHYFSVLPYSLDGIAVNKTYLEEVEIKGRSYHKIKINFDEVGGGEDFEDVFIYWVNTNTFKIEYLAYSYNEEDGVGMRFREAYNERYVNGLRFVDYNNYKVEDPLMGLFDLGKAFENNKLKLLSKIELQNIKVN